MAHAARHPRRHHHHHPRKPATLHPGKGQQKGKGPRKLHVHHHPKVHKGHAKRKHHHLKHHKHHLKHHLKRRQHHRHAKHHHKRHLKHHLKHHQHRHHRRHHPAARYAKVTAYRGQQATPVAAHHIHQVQLHPVKTAKAAHRPHNGTSHYAQAGAGQRAAYRGKAYGQHVRNARKLGQAGMI